MAGGAPPAAGLPPIVLPGPGCKRCFGPVPAGTACPPGSEQAQLGRGAAEEVIAKCLRGGGGGTRPLQAPSRWARARSAACAGSTGIAARAGQQPRGCVRSEGGRKCPFPAFPTPSARAVCSHPLRASLSCSARSQPGACPARVPWELPRSPARRGKVQECREVNSMADSPHHNLL